jgi:hypothetical protein
VDRRAVFGGPEAMHSSVGEALSTIKRLAVSGGPDDDSGSLDIVFHVPASLVRPDYESVRTGRLSKKQRLLQVQMRQLERALTERAAGERHREPWVVASWRCEP